MSTRMILVSAMMLLSAAAWGLPANENVHSISGFYQNSLSMPVVQVPVQTNSGSCNPTTQFLSLNPIGRFRYDTINDGQDFYTEPYPYTGPYHHQIYAAFGWWQMVANRSDVWGIFAAGSPSGFQLPTTGAGTYCGFWNAWVVNPQTKTVDAMGGEPVLVQTSFQHIRGTTHATINTFFVPQVGATTSGGIAIQENGTATVTFKTYGPNGVTLNGGLAKSLVEFYGGSSAVQLSASFSGPWRGSYLISGGLLANRVPGNPGRCGG